MKGIVMENENVDQSTFKMILSYLRAGIAIAYAVYGAVVIARIIFEWTKAGITAIHRKIKKK